MAVMHGSDDDGDYGDDGRCEGDKYVSCRLYNVSIITVFILATLSMSISTSNITIFFLITYTIRLLCSAVGVSSPPTAGRHPIRNLRCSGLFVFVNL